MQKIYVILALLVPIILFGYSEAGRILAGLWFVPAVAFALTTLLLSAATAIGALFRPLFGRGVVGGSAALLAGLWSLSLAALVVGRLGLMSPAVVLVLLIAPSLLGWRTLRAQWRSLWSWLGTLKNYTPADMVLLVTIALLLVAILFLASAPALDFDVLEYHLGVPADYLRLGRIDFLPHNIYASFPQMMEMQAYLLLNLFNQQIVVALAAQYLNVSLTLVLSLVVYSLGAKLSGERSSGLVAALLCLILPWTTVVAQKFYVEIPLTLAFLLALYYSLDKLDRRSTFAVAALVSIGSAVKYNMLFFALPILLLLIMRQGRRAVGASITIALLGVATNPWLWCNWYHTGNPFYPLLGSLFPAGSLRAADVARWDWAHQFHGEASFIDSIYHAFSQQWVVTPLLILLAVLASRVCWRERQTRLIALAAGVWVLLWCVATHRIPRFLYPSFVLLMIVAAQAYRPALALCGRRLVYALMALSVVLSLLITTSGLYVKLPVLFGQQNYRAYLAGQLAQTELIAYMEEHLQVEKLFSFGDAKGYYYPLNMELAYHTVFTTAELEAIAERGFLNYLRNQGIDYFVVDYSEVARYQESYRYPFEGEMRPGFLPEASLRALMASVGQAQRVWPPAYVKNPPLVLYRR